MKDIEKVIDEFDDKYKQETAFSTVIPAGGVRCGDIKEIKDFIRTALTSQLHSIREKIEGKRKEPSIVYSGLNDGDWITYNQALDEILQELTSSPSKR